MDSVPPGHEAEVNADEAIGAALLAALRQWREEGEARAARPDRHDEGSDEEVA